MDIHVQQCSDAVCVRARQFEEDFLQLGILPSDDYLLKATSDLIIFMKKYLKPKHENVCLNELSLFSARCLWSSMSNCGWNRKFIQVLSILERINKESIKPGLNEIWKRIENEILVPFSNENQKPLNKDGVAKMAACTTLLDSVSLFRDVVAPHVLTFLSLVNRLLMNQHLSSEVIFTQHIICVLTKLTLQLCQIATETSRCSFEKEDVEKMILEDFIPQDNVFLETIRCSFITLRNQDRPKDCLLVAGSVLSMLLSTVSSPADFSFLVLLLLDKLSNVSDEANQSNPDLNPPLAARLTLGHLSLMSGIIAYTNIDKLISMESDTKQNNENTGTDVSLDAGVIDDKPAECANNCRTTREIFRIKKQRNIPVLLWLFDLACDTCSMPENRFQSFKFLDQWFQKLMQLPTTNFEWSKVLSEDGYIVQETLHLVFTHIDSTVDGVGENVTALLNTMFKVTSFLICHASDLEKKQNGLVVLTEAILTQTSSLPWHVKGRYTLLSVALEHLPMSEVLNTIHVLDDLQNCLSTNYLTPSATNVYKCILTTCSSNPEGLSLWMKHCWPVVLRALVSKNSLMSKNASQYWMPVTLRKLPGSLPLMISMLKENQDDSLTVDDVNYLFAHLSVLSAARLNDLKFDPPYDLIRQSFYKSSNDLRMIAFNLLCVSLKTTDPLKPSEIELLKFALPENMNVDSPAFRKQVQTCLHGALVRIRDASLSNIRCIARNDRISPNGKTPDDVQVSLEFVDFVWKLCFYNMSPGANFQRLQTALSWVRTVLDVFIHRPHQSARKGLVPADVDLFLSIANKHGCCQFFSDWCSTNLLTCVFCEIDEISEMASDILALYFPWPLKLCLPEQVQVITVPDLIATSLGMCNSFRARECRSGALLCSMVFEKLVVEQNKAFHLQLLHDGGWNISSVSDEQTEPSNSWITQLLKIVEDVIPKTADQIVISASTNPLHGLVSAIRYCLMRKFLKIQSTNHWQLVMIQILEVTSQIVNVVLSLFGGKLASNELVATAPSFEQMSQAIDELIGDIGNDDAVLSPEHQLISTWCWLNIKESSLLLGHAVGVFLESGSGSGSGSSMIDVAESSGQLFLKVLTQCRHKGAIEGCSLGFSEFCSSLLQSTDADLADIPGKLLQQVLNQVDALSAASVTRRSAGLPIVVRTILANEAKLKQSKLLHKTIKYLLTILGAPLPSTQNQHCDLPHVHAMNILKAIVHESRLSGYVAQYIEVLTIHALNGFSSHSWAIRNGSLQLFGSLVSRLLGEKKTREDDLQLITASEFFLQYPSLCESIERVLVSAVDQVKASRFSVPDSRLMPVLSLMMRLGSGPDIARCSSTMSKMRGLVNDLSSSSILAVRQLSSKALVPLVSKETLCVFVQELVSQLPTTVSDVKSFNHLHGLLLQIEQFLIFNRNLFVGVDQIQSQLKSKSWLLTRENPCPLVRMKFLQLLIIIHDGKNAEWLDSEMEAEIRNEIFTENIPHSVTIGESLYIETSIHWWLSNSDDSNCSSRTVACLTSCMSDVVAACLSWILKSYKDRSQQFDVSKLQDCLWSLVKEFQSHDSGCKALEVLVLLHRESDCCALMDFDSAWNVLRRLVDGEISSTPATLSLTLMAYIVKHYTIDQTVQHKEITISLEDWTELVQACCSPRQSLGLRLSVAEALRVAAPSLVQFDLKNNMDADRTIFLRVLKSLLVLLFDESLDVRELAARTVGCLQFGSLSSKDRFPPPCFDDLHHNLALKLLLDRIVSLFDDFQDLVFQIFDSFLHVEKISDILSKHLKSRCHDGDVFQAEDDNPFDEPFQLYNQITICLQKHTFLAENKMALLRLSEVIASTVAEFEVIISSLHTNSYGVLMLLSDKKVSNSFFLLSCRAILLLGWSGVFVRSDGEDEDSVLTSMRLDRDVLSKLNHEMVRFIPYYVCTCSLCLCRRT